MGRHRKYLEFAALLILAVGIIWWFGRRLDWGQVKLALLKSDWRLIILACGVILLGYLWRAIRWRAFLTPLTKASLREVWIAVERVYDSMTVLLFFAVNLLWFKPTPDMQSDFGRARVAGFVFLGLAVVAVAVLVWFRWRSQSVIRWLDYRINAGSSVALANLLVCRAFGLQFGMSKVLFVVGFSMVGSAVPTPGGAAGAFHAATGAALVLLGVGREQAAAVSIILHLVDFGPAALFGLFYFLRGDVNLARLRSLTSANAVEHAVEDEKVALA